MKTMYGSGQRKLSKIVKWKHRQQYEGVFVFHKDGYLRYFNVIKWFATMSSCSKIGIQQHEKGYKE